MINVISIRKKAFASFDHTVLMPDQNKSFYSCLYISIGKIQEQDAHLHDITVNYNKIG